MKEAILQHFAGNWLPFYEGYLGELKKVGKQHRALCLGARQRTPIRGAHGEIVLKIDTLPTPRWPPLGRR